MAKNEKSKAELYREERKQRIASAAKKNARKSRKHPKAGKAIAKIVGIVAAVAVVGLVCFGILNTTGVFARMQTALTVGDNKISVAEYGYMYYMQYENTVSQAQNSEQQYGYNIYGFDYTKAPEDQDSPYQDDDGNTLNWAQELKKNTIDYFKEFYTLYDLAVKDNYTVTEEEQSDIDEQIESLRSTAAGDGTTSSNSISMSLNSYLKAQYGPGVTEGFLRNLMEREMIVQRYSEDKQDEIKEKYDDETVDKEYKADTTAYDVVDLRAYSFTPETLEAKDGESEEDLAKRQEAENKAQLTKANTLLKAATSEEAFKAAAEVYILEQEEAAAEEEAEAADAEAAEETADDAAAEDAEADDEKETDHDSATKSYGITKSSLTSSISEDAANWAFDASRKAGDKKVFTSESGTAFAVYVVKSAYPQESVDVRHILFMTVDSESGEKLSEEEIAEKKKKCDDVLAEWEAGEKTEDAFAQLANDNSDDTGSNTNGGLYENVTPGQMVSSFDSWIFDDSRKEGDVEVIESEYGYHIMYYVGNRDLAYRDSIRTTKSQDDYSTWLEDTLETVAENSSGIEKGYARADRLIQAAVKYLQSNAGSSSDTALS